MKIDRMIGILSILLQKDKVTAPYLAEKFEVSRRTINRDIEELCRAGIPLRTTQGVNGGISIMDGYKIDSTLLTSSDMQEILAGLRSLDSVSGTNQVVQLMEKLSAGSSTLMPGGQNILIDLSSWYRDTLAPKIQLIREAMDRRQKICFQYYSPNGESIREVEPYYLIFQWANWYVWGYCAKREDYRLFKLNRMTELKPGETFEKRNVPLPDLSNERIFPQIYQVKALIDPEFRWRLVEEYGPDSFIVQEDGRLLFSFGFTDEESILGWILSFRGGAKLLEPEPLRGIMDFGANVTLTGGVCLQTKESWLELIQAEKSRQAVRDGVVFGGLDAELYFEEDDFDAFIEKAEKLDFLEYVHPAVEHPWGQRVVRFYDPDRHVIEVGEKMETVCRRFLDAGMTAQEIAERMNVPIKFVNHCIRAGEKYGV